MCAPLIPSWSFTLTVSKETNNLPWLPQIFIRNWAAGCCRCGWPNFRGLNTSCGWLIVSYGQLEFWRLHTSCGCCESWQLDLSYDWVEFQQLDTSYGWLEFQWLDTSCSCLKIWQLDTSYGWLHPTADSSSSSWIQVVADSIFQLTLVPPAGYKLQLILSCGWLEFWLLDKSCSWLHPTTDSSFSGWIWVTTDSILWLTRVPVAWCDLQLIHPAADYGWFYPAANSSTGSWTRNAANL